jgi:hypothetical protein
MPQDHGLNQYLNVVKRIQQVLSDEKFQFFFCAKIQHICGNQSVKTNIVKTDSYTAWKLSDP